MKTLLLAALAVIMWMRCFESTADPTPPKRQAGGTRMGMAPPPTVWLEQRARHVDARLSQPQTAKTNAPPRQVDSIPAVPFTAEVEASYAADAYRLCALLEGWPGKDAAETQRLLAEAVVEPLRRRIPGITKEQLARLASEFEAKISRAFQNLAASVSREHFTHAELRQLIQFFESPLGRKYARSYPAWKDRIAAGDAERQKLVAELLDRARELVAQNGR